MDLLLHICQHAGDLIGRAATHAFPCDCLSEPAHAMVLRVTGVNIKLLDLPSCALEVLDEWILTLARDDPVTRIGHAETRAPIRFVLYRA